MLTKLTSIASLIIPLSVFAQTEIVVPLPADEAQLIVTLHQDEPHGERLTVWLKQAHEDKNLLEQETHNHMGLFFGKVTPFNGFDKLLLHVPIIHSGTGQYREDHFYCLNQHLELEEIVFKPASKLYQDLAESEGVWQGEYNHFSEASKTFEFYIWHEGDANCCPTAGKVSGTYRLFSTSLSNNCSDLQILPDTFERSDIEPQY